MPFYEYECEACKFYSEVMQKITDAPLTKCPSCGKNRLKKLVSAPVFRLKGGGWYETDFKGDQEKKRNLAGAEKEEPKAESKPEAKPTEKAEAKEDKSDAKEAPAAKPAAAKAAPAARGRRSAKSAARGRSKRGARKARR